MASVAHPHLEPAEFAALQANASWTLPIEFIAGEAVVIPPSGWHAASVQGELFYALRRWQQRGGDRGLLLQDVFVIFRPDQEYAAPDISWWRAQRRPAPVEDGAIDGVPDLAVEVLSPKTRENDLGPKRTLYLRAGVRELWLVDPVAKAVTVVRPEHAEHCYEAGDVLRSVLLDGFSVRVGVLFAAT